MKKVLILGAGSAGNHIARELLKEKNKYKILGFIDRDILKLKQEFLGIKVLSTTEKIEEKLKNINPEILLIATTQIESSELQKISLACKKLKIELKIIPSMLELIENRNFVSQLKEVEIEDLLGRKEILIETNKIEENLKDRIILVTGAAGSIGSELSRQIVKMNPRKIILIDLNENELYFLELYLRKNFPDLELEIDIASIRDRKKMEYIFKKYKPEIVYHAAAHKHVPLMEKNPEEAVMNNVYGTKNLLELSSENNVSRFILISTDKAVNPTNIMGATKRLAEMLVCNANKNSKTKFMAVRFGNVLGSNGSVIPIFKKLIKEGKNLTVTHPEITRYFMTIPEASQLVLRASVLGEGGEVFVLDMGEPVKIAELAKKMIELSGLKLGLDISIDYTGLRPGEKLYEELLYDVKSCIKTECDKIYIAKLENKEENLSRKIEELFELVFKYDSNKIKEKLKEIVQTYKEPEEINGKYLEGENKR